MKRALLLIGLTLSSCYNIIAQNPNHVVLISIDGFRPEFYKDTLWPAPILQQMKSQGVYADSVRSVFPSVTYAAHSTIITGALPGTHGIINNDPFEPKGGSGAWYWYEDAIKVRTLWDAAREENLTTAAVIWPVSVGAPIDFNIPVIRPGKNKNATQLSLTREKANPPGLLEEIEMNATGKLRVKIFNNNYFIMDENISRMGAYLIEEYKPAFTAIHFISVDHFAHAEGRNGDKVKQAVGVVDRAVGSVVEAVKRAGIEGNTAFIITGDHGFVNRKTRIQPNIWLRNAGLMNNIRQGDWKAQFKPAGGSAFLYLKDKKDSATLNKVNEILTAMPEANKKYFRVIDRNELERIGADPNVALALTGKDGTVFGSAVKGEEISAIKSGGAHGFYPDFPEIHTGFIGWGAGFNKKTSIPFMGLEDISPIISELLDIPFNAPDGVLPKELLNNDQECY